MKLSVEFLVAYQDHTWSTEIVDVEIPEHVSFGMEDDAKQTWLVRWAEKNIDHPDVVQFGIYHIGEEEGR